MEALASQISELHPASADVYLLSFLLSGEFAICIRRTHSLSLPLAILVQSKRAWPWTSTPRVPPLSRVDVPSKSLRLLDLSFDRVKEIWSKFYNEPYSHFTLIELNIELFFLRPYHVRRYISYYYLFIHSPHHYPSLKFFR